MRVNQESLKSLEGKTLAIRRKKSDWNKLTMKEFFEQDFENDTDSDDVYDSDEINKNTVDDEDSELNSDIDSDSDNESNLNHAEYKKLMKLDDTDPDFYEYLKEIKEDVLDSGESNDEDNNDSLDSDDGDSENLEVASDDCSDFQPKETESDCKKIVNMQLLKTWQQEIQTDKSINTIKCAVEAFHAALNSIAVYYSRSSDTTTRYKVEGNATFNGVVDLCVTHLPDAFKRVLNLDPESQKAHKSKKFEKIQEILKLYLLDLIQLLQSVPLSHSAVLVTLLKHLHQMLPYTVSFSTPKILLKLWSTGEETVRITAFLNILLIATSKEMALEQLSTMYEEYIQTTNIVSLDTLPRINFMRNSLVEIYLLDHNISYNHAFSCIRQLAINLRNAVTSKNKENLEAVYNWKYINSLRFWTELINKSKDKSILRSLLYPLVEIITRTIKLNPTAQYYPLRFHCLEMLITISKETGTFIPLLPFLLEILDSYDFNKRHKAVLMGSISFVCILKVSKSQLVQNDFKDSIIEAIYQLILEHAASESHKIYFPELYTFCIIQLKKFLEKCHMATYCKKIKQLVTMIEENRKYIETERSKATIDLKSMVEITNWENRIKTDGTAIAKFYASCINLREQKFLTKNKEFNFQRKLMKHKLDEQNVDEDSGEEDEFKFQTKEMRSEVRVEKRPNKKIINKNKKLKFSEKI